MISRSVREILSDWQVNDTSPSQSSLCSYRESEYNPTNSSESHEYDSSKDEACKRATGLVLGGGICPAEELA